MKKNVLLLLLLLGYSEGNTQEKSLLWEISGNGLAQPSYIYGTIHVICPTDYFMTDLTKAAFDKTEQVYLELDMDDPKLMPTMTQKMLLADGKKLKDFLSTEDYTFLSEYLKQKMGMGLDRIDGMKPFAVMSLIYMSLLSCQPQSYELVFTQMAINTKKELLGLETVGFQMSIFDQIPYQKQAKMMVEMVRKKETSVKEFGEMVALYKKQDIEELLKMMDSSEWDFNGYEDILLANRNMAWIPIMVQAMQAKATFFAVGAGHLGGEKGVLKLLSTYGYKLKPMY